MTESGLDPSRLRVSVSSTSAGGLATVDVWYRAPTDVAVVGQFVGDVELHERVVVLREPSGR